MSGFCQKLSTLSLIHDFLALSLKETLLSASELKRVRQMLADAEAAGAAGDPGPGDAMMCWRILRGKRILSTEKFVNDKRSRFRFLGIIVGCTPIDKLFSTFYEAEQYARERTAAMAPVGLLESMVDDKEGILLRTHRALAWYVFDGVSPFTFISSMASNLQSVGQDACRSLRAL